VHQLGSCDVIILPIARPHIVLSIVAGITVKGLVNPILLKLNRFPFKDIEHMIRRSNC